jgi:hypothetical protein
MIERECDQSLPKAENPKLGINADENLGIICRSIGLEFGNTIMADCDFDIYPFIPRCAFFRSTAPTESEIKKHMGRLDKVLGY